MPQTPATGTASAGFFGRMRVKNDDGTNAAMAPDTTTPSTRNGMAWTQTETKVVAQVCMAGTAEQRCSGSRSRMPVSRISPKISSEPGRYLGFGGVALGVIGDGHGAAPPGSTGGRIRRPTRRPPNRRSRGA